MKASRALSDREPAGGAPGVMHGGNDSEGGGSVQGSVAQLTQGAGRVNLAQQHDEQGEDLGKSVGFAEDAGAKVTQRSGGEQQRVSIARALATQPKLLLADEPTGDLDDQTAGALFALVERLHTSYGLTSILVTHNMPLARRCGRVMRLAQGQIKEVSPLAV